MQSCCFTHKTFFWRSCYRRSFVRSLTLNLWLLWFCSLWLVDTVNALKVGHLRDRPWLSVWEMCPRLIVSRGNVTPVILKLNQFAMNTRVEQNSSKLEHCNSKVELISHCTIKRSFQANVHGFVAWKRNSLTLRTEARLQDISIIFSLLSCRAPAFPFWSIFHYIKHFKSVRWRFQKCLLSVL